MKIGIVGDYTSDFPPHPATDAGLGLQSYDALVTAPGSPYASLDGALAAIRYARERGVPLLGTCGGLQHIILEYARSVLGFEDAQHAEYDPYASRLFLVPFSCTLFGQTMRVILDPASRAAGYYGRPEALEQYYCNFGLNPEYRDVLHDGGLRIVGWDDLGEARVFEIPGHPFFLGTLYVPQLRSTPERPHPLLTAFLTAAADHAKSDEIGRAATPRG